MRMCMHGNQADGNGSAIRRQARFLQHLLLSNIQSEFPYARSRRRRTPLPLIAAALRFEPARTRSLPANRNPPFHRKVCS